MSNLNDLIAGDIDRALDDLLHGMPAAPIGEIRLRTALRTLAQRVQANTRTMDRFGLLTTAEVAERYNVNANTVTKWCRNGLLPGAEAIGVPPRVTWLIPEEKLEFFTPPTPGRRSK